MLVVACSGSAKIGSIGAVLARDNDTHLLYVSDAPSGLAADKAGLVPGDQIIMIDGVFVRDLDVKEIRQKLRGEIGTKVRLTVLRGREVIHADVTRVELIAGKPAVRPKEEKLEE